jgi:uncharacterized protein
MFAIEITSLSPGLHSFDFEPEVEELELSSETFKEAFVRVRLDVRERRILVRLEARAVATLECDRTLRRFDQVIEGTHHVLFAPAAFVEQQEDAFDDVRTFAPSDQRIDLTQAVRDTLLLAIPHRRVAPGADEEEIPMQFGAPEHGGDPRWEALRRLRAGPDQR